MGGGTEQIEGKWVRGKLSTTYMASWRKRIVEQGLEKIAKEKDIKSYKGQKILDSHESQCPEIDTQKTSTAGCSMFIFLSSYTTSAITDHFNEVSVNSTYCIFMIVFSADVMAAFIPILANNLVIFILSFFSNVYLKS